MILSGWNSWAILSLNWRISASWTMNGLGIISVERTLPLWPAGRCPPSETGTGKSSASRRRRLRRVAQKRRQPRRVQHVAGQLRDDARQRFECYGFNEYYSRRP